MHLLFKYPPECFGGRTSTDDQSNRNACKWCFCSSFLLLSGEAWPAPINGRRLRGRKSGSKEISAFLLRVTSFTSMHPCVLFSWLQRSGILCRDTSHVTNEGDLYLVSARLICMQLGLRRFASHFQPRAGSLTKARTPTLVWYTV